MSSSGESSVSYLCPQCQAKLTASAQHAGQRRECPQCGKMVKVPGTAGGHASASSSKDVQNRPPSQTGGIANIPVICPLCGTRMHASKDQIGQPIVCPDCLESVVVPDLSPPKEKPQRPVADLASPNHTAPAQTPANMAEETPDDDYQLSDPVDLPRHRSVTGAMGDLIDKHVGNDDAGDGSEPIRPPIPKPPARRQFAIKCPVCDTMLQATEDEIGSTKECPDCYSSMTVTRPRPKPRRVNEVVESDYANDDYTLGAPAELDVYRPTAKDVAPRTVGEEALQKARDAQIERERDAPSLPLKPLVSGVFVFLPNAATITRIFVTGFLLGVCIWGTLTVFRLTTSGNASDWLFGLVGFMVLFLGVVVTVSYTSINLLTLLQESAEGCEQVENWPENSLADWITESFTLLIAVFFAISPGMLTMLTSSSTGMSIGVAWIFIGASLYMLFPVIQLSILETASLANPFSPPIIESIKNEFLLWCTFYIMTFFLALAVAFALASVRVDHPIWVYLALGLFLSFASFVYFRLLGRLAWACQMHPPQQKPAKDDEGEPERERK